MTESELKTIFAEALGIDVGSVTDELAYQTIPQWDSISHMALVAAIEGGCDIMFETQDIVDLSSFAKAKEILAENYEIQIS